MNKKHSNQHLVDVLFVLALFAIFVLCGIFLILMGSHIYKKNLRDMNANYSSRTVSCYLTEKIRQTDFQSNIYIDTLDNTSVLCILQNFGGQDYITYIYEDEGFLKELFCRKENVFYKSQGNKIFEISGFHVEKLNPKLLFFEYRNDSNELVSFYIHVAS